MSASRRATAESTLTHAERRTTSSVSSVTPAGRRAAELIEQQPPHLGPERLDGLADGREGWVGVRGELAVVEPDQRHVVGDASSRRPQSVERAHGHEVGGGEDAVDFRVPLEQPFDRRGRAGAAEVTLGHQRRRRRAAGLTQGLAPAGQPVGAGCHVEGAGDRGDRAATAPDQVGAGTAGPADVVGVDEADGRRVRSVAGMPGDDARDHGGDEPAGQWVVPTGRQQQHAVRVAPQQQAFDALPVGLVLDHQQHQLVARAGERCGDPADRSGEEGIPEQAGARLRDRECDGVAAVRRQAPRGTVGRIAELVDRVLDGDASPVRHAGAAVDDPRHGCPRDACAGGHVLQRAPGGGRPGQPVTPRAGRWRR